MSIDKNILFKSLLKFITSKYMEDDKELIIDLVKKVIFNNPEKNCHIKGKKHDWDGLPPSKSLFTVKKDKGLPIGNLTSQVFANFYLDFFDHYVKDECGVKYYGRYVDDFVIIHKDKEYLLKLKENLKSYIYAKLQLKLHPRKVYLQHYTKGVKFIGAVIKPGREYIGNRTKGNLYAKIKKFNDEFKKNPKAGRRIAIDMMASINSYLGFMIHYKTFKIRKKMLEEYLFPIWKKYIIIDDDMNKISLKKWYKPNVVKVKKLKRRRCCNI